jgi:hypothetical protein
LIVDATKSKSPFSHLTTEHRTRIGYVLYLDSYEKKFQFTRELLSGSADMEVRMALFWAVKERHVDMNSLEDAEFIFSNSTTSLLQEAKDWAQEHQMKLAQAIMPFIDEETIRAMAALMRQPEKPLSMSYAEMRRDASRETARSKRRSEEQRTTFNSQHKPAPEGTVKELAARYGKSIGEIRKLKAANLLHTLEGAQV